MFSGSGIKSEKHKIGSTINGDLIMKLRDKILYMSFGAGLVVLGMMLNSLVSGDAEAQGGVKDATFRNITCEVLMVKGVMVRGGGVFIWDENNRTRGRFALDDDGDAFLEIKGDDGKSTVAYLGRDAERDEMRLSLRSRSTTDKREVSMHIDENGGRFDCDNKMGESVVRLGVGNDGSGVVDKRDKFGYKNR